MTQTSYDAKIANLEKKAIEAIREDDIAKAKKLSVQIANLEKEKEQSKFKIEVLTTLELDEKQVSYLFEYFVQFVNDDYDEDKKIDISDHSKFTPQFLKEILSLIETCHGYKYAYERLSEYVSDVSWDKNLSNETITIQKGRGKKVTFNSKDKQ